MMENGKPVPASQCQVRTVCELTRELKDTLETAFPDVWVSGEVTNLSRPRSGHLYLALKDSQAQIRAVLWRSQAARLKFDLQDGLEVICAGSIDLYPPRGSYQLVIRQIEPRGAGALQLALRQLQERLAAEGLFAAERKRPLPRIPQRIALVTSPAGAAIHDFLKVLQRRWPDVDVIVVPTRVQGAGAAEEIAAAIRLANQMAPSPEVLVVGRGGGSLEDLWCFNEEIVVRAIHGSRIPVVSAVGHEVDVTLADLVADVRALTPSEAAERVVPDGDDMRAGLAVWQQRLAAALRARAATARQRLAAAAQSPALRRPLDRLGERARRLDELDQRAARAVAANLAGHRQRLERLAGQLASLSPLSVLGRGYSITARQETGELLTDVRNVRPDDTIETRLARGRLVSRVQQVVPEEAD